MRLLVCILLVLSIAAAQDDTAARAEFDGYRGSLQALRITSGAEPYAATWRYTAFGLAANKNLNGELSITFASPRSP